MNMFIKFVRVITCLLLFYCPIAYTLEKAYVANTNGTVTVIDTSNDSVLTTINISGTIALYGVVAHPDGSKVYVIGNLGFNATGNLYVIDTAADALIATTQIVTNSGYSQNAAITPDGTKLYITTSQGYATYVINTLTNGFINSIAGVSGINSGIAIASISGVPTAFIANAGGNIFYTINTTNDNQSAWPGQIAVGKSSYSVAITPDATKAYFGSGNSGNAVYVINTASHTRVATISLSSDPSRISAIAITPSGTASANKAYVAYGTSVGVINTLTDSLSSSITIGATTVSVAVTSDGTKAYVSNGANLSIIKTSTDTVIGSPINIGGVPQGIAIAVLPVPKPPTPTPNSAAANLIDKVNTYAPVEAQVGFKIL